MLLILRSFDTTPTRLRPHHWKATRERPGGLRADTSYSAPEFINILRQEQGVFQLNFAWHGIPLAIADGIPFDRFKGIPVSALFWYDTNPFKASSLKSNRVMTPGGYVLILRTQLRSLKIFWGPKIGFFSVGVYSTPDKHEIGQPVQSVKV